MSEEQRENLIGHPSDYGSRTLEQQKTADGEPRVERGTADSAISSDERRSGELQGDTDFEKTNADAQKLVEDS